MRDVIVTVTANDADRDPEVAGIVVTPGSITLIGSSAATVAMAASPDDHVIDQLLGAPASIQFLMIAISLLVSEGPPRGMRLPALPSIFMTT